MLDLKNRVRVQADFVELHLLDPQIYFPTAIDLPEIGYDEDETMRFFVGPQRKPEEYLYRRFRTDKQIHWCFLGERVPSPLAGVCMYGPWARMPWLRHASGEKLPLDIVTGDADWEDNRRSLLPQILPKLKEGYTIAVMYAQRTFNLNLGVERMEMVKIFPFGLEYLYGLVDKVQSPLSEHCLVCAKAPSKKICSTCKMGPYCSQVCQVGHWQTAHKQECPVLKQLRDWREMDWATYDYDRLLSRPLPEASGKSIFVRLVHNPYSYPGRTLP